jgi:hypothetical protein
VLYQAVGIVAFRLLDAQLTAPLPLGGAGGGGAGRLYAIISLRRPSLLLRHRWLANVGGIFLLAQWLPLALALDGALPLSLAFAV